MFTHDSGTGIAADPKIREAAFSDDVLLGGKNSEAIELSQDHMVVLHLKDDQKQYLQEYVNAFEKVLHGEGFTDPQTGYPAYIDVVSFRDYFILSEVTRNVDAYKKSRYFFKDRESNGGKIHSGYPGGGCTWRFGSPADRRSPTGHLPVAYIFHGRPADLT